MNIINPGQRQDFFVIYAILMEKSFLQIDNNVNIAYRWIEPTELKDNTVLVFLHEALGSILQWRRFPQLLCDSLGLKGLIYERQGYGDSSPLMKERDSNYLEEYAVDEMPQVIERLLPKTKVMLVGHSDGGSIALMYASKFPENVASVVTMAAHVIVEPETTQGIYPAIEAFQAGKLDGLKKYHGDKTAAIFNAWFQTWLSAAYQQWTICSKIHQTLPSLILQGEKDEYGTKKQLELILEKLPNATTYLIPDVHHQPHLEQPEIVVGLIEDWVIKRSSSHLNSI